MPVNRRQVTVVAFAASMSTVESAHAGLLGALAAAAKGAKGATAAKAATAAGGATLAAEEIAAQAANAAKAAEAAQATAKLRQALGEFEAAQGKQGAGVHGAGSDTHYAPKAKMESHAFTQTLPSGRLKLLRSVGKMLNRLPRVVFASASAKRFGNEFLAGSKNATLHLQALRKKNAALVDPWLSVPPEKRVFIIGASQSSAEITLLKAALESDGFKTFFYKFCEPYLTTLCSSGDVGAFFSTSGHVISAKSAQASKSAFIPVELAAADSVIEGAALIIFSPDDVAALAKSATVPVQVEVFEFNDSDVNRKRTA